MGFLTDYEDGEVEFQGARYPVDLAYDTVLNVQRMYREKLLDDADLILESLHLFRIPEKTIEKMTWQERQDLLEKIFREKIIARKRPQVGKQQRLFDFEDDGEYIYASFLQAYGIDLIEQQGKLPWQSFIALFQGLPEKTKIREVMRIRGMDVPEGNGRNQKEIQQIMELKAYYALGYHEENGADGLNRLFNTLERCCV